MKNLSFIQITPNKSAAIYTAASVLSKRGPLRREELFAAMDFGPADMREKKLAYAFEIDWLRETSAGLIELTEYSKRHFAARQPKEKYVGQVAPPAHRPNLLAGTLSKKHIPNRRGPRADAPPAYGENPTFRRA